MTDPAREAAERILARVPHHIHPDERIVAEAILALPTARTDREALIAVIQANNVPFVTQLADAILASGFRRDGVREAALQAVAESYVDHELERGGSISEDAIAKVRAALGESGA